MDEVGFRPGGEQPLEQARGAVGVEGERVVEGLLEGDGRGAVDDGVDPGPLLASDPGQAVAREIAGDRLDAARLDPRSDLVRGEVGEGVVGQDLVEEPAARPLGVGRPQQHHDPPRSAPTLRRSAARTALPRNPDAPVSRTFLPARRSRTLSPWPPWSVTGAILGVGRRRSARPSPAAHAKLRGAAPKLARIRLNTI